MTDAHLMDADCIHGVTWWECEICEWEQSQLDDQATDDDWNPE